MVFLRTVKIPSSGTNAAPQRRLTEGLIEEVNRRRPGTHQLPDMAHRRVTGYLVGSSSRLLVSQSSKFCGRLSGVPNC